MSSASTDIICHHVKWHTLRNSSCRTWLTMWKVAVTAEWIMKRWERSSLLLLFLPLHRWPAWDACVHLTVRMWQELQKWLNTAPNNLKFFWQAVLMKHTGSLRVRRVGRWLGKQWVRLSCKRPEFLSLFILSQTCAYRLHFFKKMQWWSFSSINSLLVASPTHTCHILL